MKKNWYVITGAPSSGKTKTLEYIAFMGYQTIPESARIYIDLEMSKGKSLDEIRKNQKEFQHMVFKLKIEAEERLKSEEVVFFDRGLQDSIAFYNLHGLDTNEITPYFHNNYRKVFLLDPLTYQLDYGRNETEEQAMQLHEKLKEAYELSGYDVIAVPKDTIEKRVEYIFDRL